MYNWDSLEYMSREFEKKKTPLNIKIDALTWVANLENNLVFGHTKQRTYTKILTADMKRALSYYRLGMSFRKKSRVMRVHMVFNKCEEFPVARIHLPSNNFYYKTTIRNLQEIEEFVTMAEDVYTNILGKDEYISLSEEERDEVELIYKT